MPKITSYLGIGSNLGDRTVNIKNSIRYLESNSRIAVKKISRLYETLPQGGPKKQPKYLNAAAKIETSLPPSEFLKQLKLIEKRLKRRNSVHWGPRTIDLDILFYDDLVFINKELTIPHPLLDKRAFVLEPLSEIAASYIHPLINKSIKELLLKRKKNSKR